jgi:hypothetical protein
MVVLVNFTPFLPLLRPNNVNFSPPTPIFTREQTSILNANITSNELIMLARKTTFHPEIQSFHFTKVKTFFQIIFLSDIKERSDGSTEIYPF